VRVNGDHGRRTRETDFLVITGGVPGILELDGAPHDGRAADDHAKDRASKRAGIWVVERVPSAEALRAPDRVVERFLGMLRAYGRRAA
jgi:very-short-patch-repair endonuclease